MRHPAKVWGYLISIALFATSLSPQQSEAPRSDEAGPCQPQVEAVVQEGTAIDIYYPQGACTADLAAPFPAVAYAHGFSFFGLSDGAGDNSGNGMHLASWGYIVAVPTLPDDAEARVAKIVQALDFLAATNEDPTSFLYGQVDIERFAVAGHSLGGATALAVAARDARIKVAVALDPVYHARTLIGAEYLAWDPAAEGPAITVPTSILGAPADACNSQADYKEIYPFVGSTHKASYHLVSASHCVFADPGTAGCDLLCGGQAGPDMTQLSQKYMTAWLNYYLRGLANDYDGLYGAGADADISTGTITRDFATSPQNLSARSKPKAVELQWTFYDHAVIAGYHVYRRLPGQPFSNRPFASAGLRSSYLDTQVTSGQPYIYTVRSYDPAGNLHQESGEGMAVPQEGSVDVWMPSVLAP